MKLLASDFDRTLFFDGNIKKDDLKAIKDFQAAGHLFGIVTGRGLFSIEKGIEKFDIQPDFIIGLNGGVIKVADKLVFESEISQESAQTIESLILEYKDVSFSMAANNQDLKIIKAKEDDFFFKRHLKKSVKHLEKVTDFIVRSDNPQTIKGLKQAIERSCSDVVCHLNGDDLFDVNPIGIDKAFGVSKIADYFKCKEEDIFVIGDAQNDLSMIQTFQGYCRDNAISEVKQASLAIVDDFSELIHDIIGL